MTISRKSATFAIAATAALLVSGGATAIGSPHLKAAAVATPQLTIKLSGKNSALDVTGPRRFSAGRVNVTLIAGKGEQAFDIVRLHNGYSYADLIEDFGTYAKSGEDPTPEALKALNHLVKNTTFLGGLDSGIGHTTLSGSVVLAKPATYYLFNDSAGPNVDVKPVKLHVSAREGSRAAPASTATVRATAAKRFKGSVNLPASGTITFENAATDTPHFMGLQHIKKGTTRKQVIKALQSSGPGPTLPGTLAADVVSPGHSMTMTYDLPAGDYAVMCFFPDLKTGMPHAFMGMVDIVHLS